MRVGLRLGWITGLAATIGAAGLAACSSSPQSPAKTDPAGADGRQTDGKQTATYRGRILSTDFPRHVRVPAVAAAAEMALRHRGYAITKSPVTEDYARIEGSPPKAGWFEKVVVRTRQTSSRTRVEVIAEPLGDQVLSRSILEEMTASLGTQLRARR